MLRPDSDDMICVFFTQILMSEAAMPEAELLPTPEFTEFRRESLFM